MLRPISRVLAGPSRYVRLPVRASRRASTQTQHGSTTPAQNDAPLRHGLKLRPYQEECIQTVLSAFENGRRQVGVSLATGAGKTVIFTELIGRVKPQSTEATQTLILVHRRELVEQAAQHCQNRYPDKRVDIEMGSRHASGYADITVASVQSITSRDRIDKFRPEKFKLILVDEAHHIVASTYLAVLNHFNLAQENVPATAPALMGVSATLSRFDGLALGKAIKHIVYHKDYADMIGESWLSDVIFTTVKSNANLSKVKKSQSTGDFLTSSLSQAVNTPETNEVTVRAWLDKARTRRSTIVFCIDVAHIQDLSETFRRHGIEARYVTGETPTLIRQATLNAFKAFEFPVLLNCGVFTEGTDIPNIDCVLLARPTRSRNLLVQMIGRGMRLHPEKRNCHVIDMVSSLESGIVTTPTLFGLDPDELVDGDGPDTMRTKKAQRQAAADKQLLATPDSKVPDAGFDPLVTFTDYDSVAELISDTAGERHVRALSPNAWVQVGPRRFVLSSTGSSSWLTIEGEVSEPSKPAEPSDASELSTALTKPPTEPPIHWRARHSTRIATQTKTGKPSTFTTTREVAHNSTFEGIVRGADTFAGRVFAERMVRTAAQWRRGPASASQLEYLNRHRPEDEALTPETVSKGHATDMITKLVHGARGQFAAVSAARRREGRRAKAAEEGRIRQEAEKVVVGPVRA